MPANGRREPSIAVGAISAVALVMLMTTDALSQHTDAGIAGRGGMPPEHLSAVAQDGSPADQRASRVDLRWYAPPGDCAPIGYHGPGCARAPGASTVRLPFQQESSRPSPWWAPLASAAVPGTGQLALRQERFAAYMAVEAYAWLRFRTDIREAHRQRNAYRALAANVARAFYSDDLPVGSFEYYERMEYFVESGVYNHASDESLQPETDIATYNGFIWLRARTTFWADPELPPDPESAAYQRALLFYSERAVRPEFRWSWRHAQLEQDLFRRTIALSNDAFRRSIEDLGIIIANHVLSTVDAYVTIRLRSADAAPDVPGTGIGAGGASFPAGLAHSQRIAVTASVPWPDAGPSWIRGASR
jgi:hypothetical protein